MAPPLLALTDIHLSFGGTSLLDGAELSLSQYEKTCLVGRNGSGKSTLLKIVAAMVEPDRGEVFVQPGKTVGYLPQEPDLTMFPTLDDYIHSGLGPNDDHYQATYLLAQLGLSGDLDPSHLSGGEIRRAALVHTLAPSPDIILLDEPTNHLDLPAIEWLESHISKMSSSIIMISHDRKFLENTTNSTVWLDRGQTRKMRKGFGSFETWRDEWLEQEQVEQHKLDRKIAREEDWLRYGVTARRKRNQRRLRALHDLRQSRRDYRPPVSQVEATVASGENSGKIVIDARSVSKSFGDRVIAENFSIRIARGDRLGIVGPNGIGKTTLISILTGLIPADEGSVKLGANLEIVWSDQNRDSLDSDWTLKQALTGGSGDFVEISTSRKHVMSYMKDFLFQPEQSGTPVSRLSGGERGRLILARALAMKSNLLVLDEPTNDLDMETLDVLEEIIGDYEGTVIMVSHDRDFLDRVATSILTVDENKRWTEYAGGYSDMIAQKNLQGGADIRIATENSELTGGRKKNQRNNEQSATVASGKSRKKLSYKQQYALEHLPEQMQSIEDQIAEYREALSDPNLFQKDPDEFARISDGLDQSTKELTRLEEEWLNLELLREELEAG